MTANEEDASPGGGAKRFQLVRGSANYPGVAGSPTYAPYDHDTDGNIRPLIPPNPGTTKVVAWKDSLTTSPVSLRRTNHSIDRIIWPAYSSSVVSPKGCALMWLFPSMTSPDYIPKCCRKALECSSEPSQPSPMHI